MSYVKSDLIAYLHNLCKIFSVDTVRVRTDSVSMVLIHRHNLHFYQCF